MKPINSKPNLEKDWEEADRYFPSIVKILQSIYGKNSLIEIASPELDLEKATDYLLTLRSESKEILVACRVRELKYFESYGDITIRSRRPSGAKTELAKLAEGFADIYFYGWGTPPKIIEYDIWCLHTMRSILQLRYALLQKGKIREIPNKDGSSHFIAISRLTIRTNQAMIKSSSNPNIAIFMK